MSQPRTRAWRRHHKERTYHRARKILLSNWSYSDPNPDEDRIHIVSRMRQDILCGCSCPMCGNERHNGWLSRRECLTTAERRAEDAFKDWVIEVDSYPDDPV